MDAITTGQILDLTIEKLTSSGEGLARIKTQTSAEDTQQVIFVPYALPGEKVKAQITDARKKFARARLLEVYTPHPERIAPECPYYFKPGQSQTWCGGCNFQHAGFTLQLAEKLKTLNETCERIGGFKSLPLAPVKSTGSPWRYRNKIQIPFNSGQGQAQCGFFAPDSHTLVPIDDCLIHPEMMMRLVRFVRQKMAEWNLPGYNEKKHQGWLRNLIVRQSLEGKLLVIFVTLNPGFPRKNDWTKELQTNFPELVGICQNVNPVATNVILGKSWQNHAGQSYLTEVLNGFKSSPRPIKIKISAPSFFQVNTLAATALYQEVEERVLSIPLSQRQSLLDLYCGVGGMTLALAPHFKSTLGVDSTSTAIHDALTGAQWNRQNETKFYCKDVGHFLKHFPLKKSAPKSLCMILDPPRAGCEPSVLNDLIKIAPQNIIYVSCDPSTLARDLKILCAGSYRLIHLQPFDLFSQSAHIETVVHLTRNAAR